MKKFLIFMAAVFMICLVFGPKDKDLEKARRKNGLELYTYYDGYTFCYEKEFPHRIYVEDKNMKFVWYKLRYAYVPIYEPYMYSDRIQACLDLKTHKIIPISNVQPEYVESIPVNDTNGNETQGLLLSQKYTNENMGLSFMYPDGWTVVEETAKGPVWVVSPREPMFDGSAACITIEKGNIDETYFSATMSDFEEVLLKLGNEDIRVSSLDDILLSGHSARKLVYIASSDGVSLKQIFYFYIINTEMYVVGFSTYVDLWDKYGSIFEEIMDSYVITDMTSTNSDMEINMPDSEYAQEMLEDILFGYEGVAPSVGVTTGSYTDYIEWGGDYDDGWLDTTLTFSLYSDGTQDPECGYITTNFRGMEASGKLYYLGGNEFRWENEGYYFSVETYYICAVNNYGEYQLELYDSDGAYEVTFTLYEQYIP